MEFQTVIEKRRSIRNYDADKKVTKEQLEIILVVRDSVKKHIVETGSDKKYGSILEESADIPLLLYPVPLSDRGVPSEMPLGI